MQARKPSGVTPLAIVLPHPPLPRRRSSLRSATSVSSPRTPSCGSPACSTLFFSSAANRKSTDSWNSSNGPDDCEWEWKPEQTLLLTRTLDALPAHLITPFNGPVPPSNLLDKIARGVIQAKGPSEWPHSIRATRTKLLEVAKARAKEEALRLDERITEESDCDYDVEMPEFLDSEVLQPTTNIQRRRPLYRQSSMDFINAELKDNERRPLRSDRLLQVFHPYTPNRSRRLLDRSSSPPPPGAVPSLINPSTPSSSTLNSLTSVSIHSASRPRALRRTSSNVSSMSSVSSSSGMCVMPDPRVQRMRKRDTPSIYSSSSSGRGSPCMFRTPPSIFNRPLPPTPDFASPVPPSQPSTPLMSSPTPVTPATAQRTSTKRAPSFGALAQEARAHGRLQLALTGLTSGHKNSDSTSSRMYPSSDEEEKIRSRSAKKVRTKTGAADVGFALSPSPILKASKKTQDSPGCLEANLSVKKTKEKISKVEKVEGLRKADGGKVEKLGKALPIDAIKVKPSKPRPMNVQRNPSILGAELSGLAPSPMPFSPSKRENHHQRSHSGSQNSAALQSRSPALSPSPALQQPLVPVLQATQKARTLRRVRRLAPSRKISFGSLKPGDGAEGDLDGEGEESLGSAFQLK